MGGWEKPVRGSCACGVGEVLTVTESGVCDPVCMLGIRGDPARGDDPGGC